MSRGRRRDEWSRFAVLMSLVDNATKAALEPLVSLAGMKFKEQPQPSEPGDWMPMGLIDQARDVNRRIDEQRPVIRVNMKDIQAAMGLR